MFWGAHASRVLVLASRQNKLSEKFATARRPRPHARRVRSPELTFALTTGFSCMSQPNRFQKLVAEAKKHITEISPGDTQQQIERGDAVLIDVREDDDWRQDHAKG